MWTQGNGACYLCNGGWLLQLVHVFLHMPAIHRYPHTLNHPLMHTYATQQLHIYAPKNYPHAPHWAVLNGSIVKVRGWYLSQGIAILGTQNVTMLLSKLYTNIRISKHIVPIASKPTGACVAMSVHSTTPPPAGHGRRGPNTEASHVNKQTLT